MNAHQPVLIGSVAALIVVAVAVAVHLYRTHRMSDPRRWCRPDPANWRTYEYIGCGWCGWCEPVPPDGDELKRRHEAEQVRTMVGKRYVETNSGRHLEVIELDYIMPGTGFSNN